ncbi:uncharacterized protein LOC119501294 isoform X1 [Sebastes umbrosus]|uniref:uncharacterized protein LOC119501294 isoform X1 n=1 Tax=Sebastes umbrosus TaxID=72105 RepID=UPI00189DD32A|nr:uncharacterized protein LOC119501294 isoform X1 [Sebastes umbrosus]XP_037647509.1 uncharacterized protein LOC119501294 isoform X1 [Sebastes umbrosus]XP_037647510.1 uncharacterized protein LOC119501294 isoform X1 [Sebastes umbrosus]XP_037647511.1 uncharacterized protein LOC119501294 isoform X1 [Sebastes umbrosus]
MMKMSGRVTSCCVALFFVLNSVSAVQKKLHSINDLKKINFGQSVPKHSLLLLHWFANTVDIDENDVIRVAFDPNSRAYGSHQYHNFEGLLDRLDRGSGYRYYTVGSLNQGTTMQLPSYVVRPQREYVGTNSDRIIIRAREQNIGGQALQRIDQVYITQHIENQGEYDPDQTYRITTNLLRQIRQFSVGQNQQQLLQLRNRYASNADELHIRNTWGDLACLGLLLFIVIQEKYSTSQRNNRPQNNHTPQNRPETNYKPQNNRPENRRTHLDDDDSESERNVPRYFRNQGHVVVDINYDEDQEASRRTGNRESGLNNTSVPLNNNRRSFCCICCIASICVISLCAILLFIFLYKWNIK